MGWRSIGEAPALPRRWRNGSKGFYFYDIVGSFTGAPIGWRKLKRFRTLCDRADACDDFAKLVASYLPQQAVWTYMPSSSRHHCGVDPTSIEPTFRAALARHRPDVRFVEPLVRDSPIASVHESRDRDVDRLASTLARGDDRTPLAGPMYVVDNFINTGATFEAFRRTLARHCVDAQPILLAMVYTANTPRI